jgi:hypothetical protein
VPTRLRSASTPSAPAWLPAQAPGANPDATVVGVDNDEAVLMHALRQRLGRGGVLRGRLTDLDSILGDPALAGLIIAASRRRCAKPPVESVVVAAQIVPRHIGRGLGEKPQREKGSQGPPTIM